MNKFSSRFQLLLITGILLMMCSGCELAEGIFKFGFWAGVIVVVLILALLIWLVRKFFS